MWELRMTRRLIMMNICAKLFHKPLIDSSVMDRTQSRPCTWPWKPLISKCDLDLGGRDLGVVHDTPSHYGEYLCQAILKSFYA